MQTGRAVDFVSSLGLDAHPSHCTIEVHLNSAPARQELKEGKARRKEQGGKKMTEKDKSRKDRKGLGALDEGVC